MFKMVYKTVACLIFNWRDIIGQMFQISDHLADGESIIINYELADTKDQSLNQHVHLTTETYLVGIADSPDSPDDEEMVSYLRQIQVNHYAPYYTLY